MAQWYTGNVLQLLLLFKDLTLSRFHTLNLDLQPATLLDGLDNVWVLIVLVPIDDQKINIALA